MAWLLAAGIVHVRVLCGDLVLISQPSRPGTCRHSFFRADELPRAATLLPGAIRPAATRGVCIWPAAAGGVWPTAARRRAAGRLRVWRPRADVDDAAHELRVAGASAGRADRGVDAISGHPAVGAHSPPTHSPAKTMHAGTRAHTLLPKAKFEYVLFQVGYVDLCSYL